MPNPLFDAIDADADGLLTAEEIAKAAETLKKLDKDADGKISREEARPEFQGFGGRGGFGNRGDGNRGDGEGRGPGGPGGAGGGGFGQFSVEGFVAEYLRRDANADGKLDADELGDRGARMLETSDANGDKVIDKEELTKAAEAIRARFSEGGRGRPDGDRPQGDRPQGDRPPQDGDGGARPQRPASDTSV
jgi:hypothetical protein